MDPLKLIAPFAVIVAVTAPLPAGEKMLIPEEGSMEIILLRQESVRKELKLNDAKAEEIKKYAAQQWKKAQEIADLGQAEQDKKFEAMAKENDRFLEQTLSKDQNHRLHQIVLQVAGLLYVTRRDIAEKLKLTDKQKSQAKKDQQEARADLEKVLNAKDASKRHDELAELHKTNRNRLTKLLTEEQVPKWKEMTGTPFKGELQYALEVGSTK